LEVEKKETPMTTTQTLPSPSTLTASAAPRWTPPREVLAARSLAAVDRIEDRAARAAAFTAHMDRFPPTILRG
jgi:hypothetical protein